MADMLRKLFLGPVENDNEEEEINSEENLERNQSRVEQLGYVPDSFEDQSLSISQIVDRIDEGTSDRNENGTDRNIFNALSNIQSEMKELQNAVLLSNRFRVEGQIRKDLSIIAKNNFGKNIFKISDSCKTEVSVLIREEMGRPAKPSEIQEGLSFIKRKFCTEYRPAMLRTLKATMTMSKEKQLRRLFRNFTDPSTFNNSVVEKRKKLVLVMRFMQRENVLKGTFWTKVQALYDQIEGHSEEKKVELYRNLVRVDERTAATEQ